VADLLGAHGVWIRRVSENDTREGTESRWLLTYPCSRRRLDHALQALCSAAGCSAFRIRVLEDRHA
jgi:hypothetical protein